MAKRKRYITRFTRLNNKSRQGVYIAIKDSETKRERLYKWRPEYGLNYYKAMFEGGATKIKKKGVRGRGIKQKKDYLKKIKRKGRIDQWLGRGMGTAEIINVKNIDRRKIKSAYKKMIKPILSTRYKNDNLILNIFSNEENIKKLRQRIEINIEISGENEKEIRLTGIGKTIEEVLPLLQVNLGHKDLQKQDLDKFKELGFRVESSQNVNLQEYDKPLINTIQKTKLKITFRKA